MDPDALLGRIVKNLREIREDEEELERVDEGESDADSATLMDNIKEGASQLVGQVEDLVEWLAKGGAAPDWKKALK